MIMGGCRRQLAVAARQLRGPDMYFHGIGASGFVTGAIGTVEQPPLSGGLATPPHGRRWGLSCFRTGARFLTRSPAGWAGSITVF
jgi:hypothetical protein